LLAPRNSGAGLQAFVLLGCCFRAACASIACSLKLARVALLRRRCARSGRLASLRSARLPPLAQRRRNNAIRASLRLQALVGASGAKTAAKTNKSLQTGSGIAWSQQGSL